MVDWDHRSLRSPIDSRYHRSRTSRHRIYAALLVVRLWHRSLEAIPKLGATDVQRTMLLSWRTIFPTRRFRTAVGGAIPSTAFGVREAAKAGILKADIMCSQ